MGNLNLNDLIVDDIPFEKALEELEILVKKLEEGRVPLKEAVQCYERGTHLRKHCEKLLNEARLTIDQIVQDDAGEISIIPSPL